MKMFIQLKYLCVFIVIFQAVGSLCIASYTLEDPSAAGRSAVDEEDEDSYDRDSPDGLMDRLQEAAGDSGGGPLVCNSGLSLFLWQVYGRGGNAKQPR